MSDELTPAEYNALRWVLINERFRVTDEMLASEGQKWLQIKRWMEMLNHAE